MEITLDGPKTIFFVNGVKVTDYTEGQPVPERKFDFEPHRGTRPNDGYFGLRIIATTILCSSKKLP